MLWITITMAENSPRTREVPSISPASANGDGVHELSKLELIGAEIWTPCNFLSCVPSAKMQSGSRRKALGS